MSLLGMSPTVSVVRTMTSQMELAAGANQTAATSAVAKVPTTTTPATAAGRLVVPARLNYIMLQILQASGVTTTCYVIGWTKSETVLTSGAQTWIPKLLATFTSAPSTVSGAEISGLRPGLTYTKTTGDAKTYNGVDAACPAGLVLVDHCGSDLVEVHVVGSSGSCNAMYGFI